ncbi:dephospho-CoA kinase [Kytococcus sedentarius]|uniref:dephospho-CoA kinase n=1 Tax=Kytococcus sedentarius TaxID=1276 RepID=UPI0035BC962E
MTRIALTGGIAAGKSTVARRLTELGATVIDADLLSREVVAPGTAGLAAVRERFGERVIGADGALDRPTLGEIVFSDAGARRDLEGIIHPRVRQRAAELAAAAPADSPVVQDIPLLVETGQAEDFDLVLVVQAPREQRVERMVTDRGMTAEEAASRIEAQATDDERAAAADVLLDNSGTVTELLAQVDRAWHEQVLPRIED